MHTRPPPYAPRAPIGLLVAAIILALLIAAAVLAWLAWQWHTLEISAPFVADWLRYVVFIAPIVFGMWYAALGLLGLYNRWASKHASFADKTVALTLAQRSQGLPAQIQSLSYHDSHKELPAPPLLELPAPAIAIAVPTFGQLLDSGAVAADRDFVLGYSEDGAVTGDWRSLYSSGIGGLQGSGKTWTAAYLLAQSALHGAKLVICDPHAHDSESLAARVGALAPSFVCDIADTDKAIYEALQLADAILQSRKNGNADRTQTIIAVDEWSSLRRGQMADLLPKLIEDFSTEGRKLNCHILLLGQRWDKASVGDFRNTLASSYVHRMRSDEARMMTGLRAGVLPEDTLSLPPGQCYFLDTRGQIQRVAIPRMTSADLTRVGQLLSTLTTPDPGLKPALNRLEFGFRAAAKTEPLTPVSSQIQAGSNTASSLTQSGQPLTAEALHAHRLFYDENKDLAEIVFILRNLKPNQAPKYQAALKEIQALIRAASKVGVK